MGNAIRQQWLVVECGNQIGHFGLYHYQIIMQILDMLSSTFSFGVICYFIFIF